MKHREMTIRDFATLCNVSVNSVAHQIKWQRITERVDERTANRRAKGWRWIVLDTLAAQYMGLHGVPDEKILQICGDK